MRMTDMGRRSEAFFRPRPCARAAIPHGAAVRRPGARAIKPRARRKAQPSIQRRSDGTLGRRFRCRGVAVPDYAALPACSHPHTVGGFVVNKVRSLEPRRKGNDALDTPTDLSAEAVRELSQALNGLLADSF